MNAEPKLPPMPDIGTSERDFWCHTPSEMLAYGDARAAHAVAQIKARWVSVKDRLPEKNTEVLIFFKDGGLAATGQYTGSHLDHEGWCYPAENVDDDPPTVSHWMPLPEPPKA